MNGVQAVTTAIAGTHNWFNGTTADVTVAQANWLPAGVAHPIGSLMLHVLNSEDTIIHSVLQGKPVIWEGAGWDKKLRLPTLFLQENKVSRAVKLDPKKLGDYSKQVQAATLKYMSTQKDADMDRKVKLPWGDEMSQADVILTLMVGNTFAHTGEISALKGLQSAKGYPF